MIRFLVVCSLLLSAATRVACATPDAAPAWRVVAGAGGVPLAVVEWGDKTKPGILLIHGYGFAAAFWDPQIRSSLGADHHMVAFDLRGHGASGKPWDPAAYSGSKPWADDVAAVIKATGLDKPLIVGWSLGGYVAMDYVREYGQSAVSGLMLVSSPAGLADRLHPFTQGYAEAAKQRESLDLDERLRGERFFINLFTANLPPGKVSDEWLAEAMELPIYAQKAMAHIRLDNQDMLPTLTLPIEFVVGAKDRTMPFAEYAKLVKAHPSMKLLIYPDASHALSYERSDRFDRDLAAFDAGLTSHRTVH
jgi:non-heme chloroperoxidase